MTRDDPGSVILSALGGMLGWSVLLPLSVFVGMWLGGSIGQGRLATGREIVPVFFVSILAIPFVPRLMVAWLATVGLGVFGIRSESGWSRLGVPLGIALVWVLVFTVRGGVLMGGFH